MKAFTPPRRTLLVFILTASFLSASVRVGRTQDTVTGAFEGTVTNSQTGAPVEGATALIINQQTGLIITKRTDSKGRFYQGLLHPGLYTIRVSATGYETREVVQRLFITRTGEVVPVPVSLDPLPAATPTPTPIATPTPTPTPTPAFTEEDTDIRARINATDGQRGDSFTEEEVSTLPLGGRTITRTFDELALLLPGVAPPPQTLGSVAGPGVGAGVGSAGQFAVNGLRSRANNFTVDGSDNNDEDIGVRRQGFVALNSQPIESVKEYQAITLLAPAQFGRNIGAQVNAVSKSGGKDTHGAIYGFFNSSQLNARNPFDSAGGNASAQLRAGNDQPVFVADNVVVQNARTVVVNPRPLNVTNQSGGEDSFTFGQYGFVLGGPLKRPNVFYFVSTEGQRVNATKEESFAVPTVEQRGAFGTGATGLFGNPFGRRDGNGLFIDPVLTFPTTRGGDAIFSLFPFPNNPQGIYGRNTFTQTLPAGGRGAILSAKVDGRFHLRGREQSVTNRYNFTDDRRTIPVTGGALFSTLQPRVRTQNNSFFFNSEVSAPNSARPLFNQLRLSYGRTRLNFAEVRDNTFQQPSHFLAPFLLNAQLLENTTLPEIFVAPDQSRFEIRPNSGPILYLARPARTAEDELGSPVGQVNIAGFSPVGVDVFNFPQKRVNNTYQIADGATLRAGDHNFGFGTDIRRTELNSVLPNNARPLITFGGAPQLRFEMDAQGRVTGLGVTGDLIRPETLAAAGAASGFAQTLAQGGEAGIDLRYYQLDFYAQDDWRARRNLSLSFGLRYEYNTPPRETSRRIEQTFTDPSLALIPGLSSFIGTRTRIFDPDRNNFAPRFGVAYSPRSAGASRATVLRAGYGLFYDQILGAVVSLSRNVYPTYLTIDRAGGAANRRFIGNCPQERGGCPFQLISPRDPLFPNGPRLVQPGTLNTLNPALNFAQLVAFFNEFGTGGGILPPVSGFGFTIPQQQLQTPLAHQYDFTVEQQFTRSLAVSVAYVGTQGRHLLRFTTPNLGRNAFIAPVVFAGGGFCDGQPCFGDPAFYGFALPPGTRFNAEGTSFLGGRPVEGVGAVNRFETTANSRYDALQVQLRGRFRRALQFQASYTLSKATDDVSDVFDLAGSPSLPQNSFTFAGEHAPANFDARHRIAYNFIYDLPRFAGRARLVRAVFGGLQLAGTGRFQTGQPFTVNSIFDINFDGNLTDRLNTTNGITVTGNRRQPLRLNVRDLSRLLAPIGQDGQVGRNSFRAGNLLDLDLSLVKHLPLTDRQDLSLRVDAFNFINRANYGIPVRFLEAPGFGQATSTVTPARRIQFSLKYSF